MCSRQKAIRIAREFVVINMHIGTGIDLVEIDRLEAVVLKWGSYFLRRVFTPYELAHVEGKARRFQHLAARFAVKEAVRKAMGSDGGADTAWTDIEVQNDALGKPVVYLYGSMNEIRERRRISSVEVSISHTRAYAVASAVVLYL